MLLADLPAEVTAFLQTMQTFLNSGFSYLTRDAPLVFFGTELLLRGKWKRGLTHDSYRQHVHRIQPGDFHGPHASYKSKKQSHRIGRRIVGPLLRLAQSRFGIASLTIKLPTLLVSAGRTSTGVHLFLKTLSLVYKMLGAHSVVAWLNSP